jgi:sporulation and cell division protein SsgA
MSSECHWGWQEMSSNSRTEVSAELGLGLVGPEHTIVPLMASLSYSCRDPYAVKIAFHVGTDEPVEWTLARDLLAAALHSREGIGDVQAWPSAAAGDGLAGIGHKVLNISMTSPFGHAEFEASAAAVEAFLAQTYQVVPDGTESDYMNFDAELTELLSQA